MKRILFLSLMTLIALSSAFCQNAKDVLSFSFKTSVPSSQMLYFEVSSPEGEFYVDWGNGSKKKYSAGNYANPNYVYTDKKHGDEIKVYGISIQSINLTTAKITDLQIFDGSVLTHLDCSGGSLKNLDLTLAPALEVLNASNNHLASINLSKSRKLTTAWLSNNKLTSIDLTNCFILTDLDLNNNLIEGTFKPTNKSLTNVAVSNNKLTSVDLTAELPNLASLEARNNLINDVKLGNPEYLTMLDFAVNKLQSITISGLKNLQNINLAKNELIELNVSECPELIAVGASGNKIKQLDLSKCPSITSVSVEENELTSLNISGLKDLTNLECNNNQLTELDLSSTSKLMDFRAFDNKLTKLVLPESLSRVFAFHVHNNSLPLSAINAVIEKLPNVTDMHILDFEKSYKKRFMVAGNPDVERANLKVAIDKGWNLDVEPKDLKDRIVIRAALTADAPLSVNVAAKDKVSVRLGDGEFKEYDVSSDVNNLTILNFKTTAENQYITFEGPITAFECTENNLVTLDCGMANALTYLNCSNNKIQQLDVENCKNLDSLILHNNLVTHLLVGNLPKLKKLDASFNFLTSINITKAPELVEVILNRSNIAHLDLSNSAHLVKLQCAQNRLQTLDLSKVTLLEELLAGENRIDNIDFANTAKIRKIVLHHNALEALDLTSCKELSFLDVSFNKFTVESATKMINTLPTREEGKEGVLVYKNSELETSQIVDKNAFDEEMRGLSSGKHWNLNDGQFPMATDDITVDSDLAIFPTVAEVSVQISGDYQNAYVYTLNGELVKSFAGVSSFDVDDMANGIYFIKIVVDGNSVVKRFVVRH